MIVLPKPILISEVLSVNFVHFFKHYVFSTILKKFIVNILLIWVGYNAWFPHKMKNPFTINSQLFPVPHFPKMRITGLHTLVCHEFDLYSHSWGNIFIALK